MIQDTAPEALRAQADALRRMTGYQRFQIACLMSQTMRDMACARIRETHPELDERGVLDQLMLELYGFRRET